MLAVESDEVEKATSSLTEFPQSLRLLGIKMTLLAKNVSVAAVDDVVGLFGCSVLISSLHRAIVVDVADSTTSTTIALCNDAISSRCSCGSG